MASVRTVLLLLVFSILIKGGNHNPVPSRHKRPTFCKESKNEEPSSFLWIINRDPPSYFFGTIHVPYSRVWHYIPIKAKRAFESSDDIYFELNLMDRHTVSALADCQLLAPGETLANVLPKRIYQRLKEHLESVKEMISSWTTNQIERKFYEDYFNNVVMNKWQYLRPIWVLLMVNSLTENDIKSGETPMLDLYLAQEAEKLRKRIGAVENVDEQCIPLNKLNISQVSFAINQSLNFQEAMGSRGAKVSPTTEELVHQYICGNLNTVILSQDMAQLPVFTNNGTTQQSENVVKDIEVYFQEELIYKRNKKIGKRIVELLQNHPKRKFFFALGAGHFLGNNTVLDFVREGGYDINRLSISEAIYG